MKAPRRKPPPDADRQPELSLDQGDAPAAPVRTRAFSPEILAKAAVARKPTTPSGHRVQLAITLFLTREDAEALTTRALREGRNVAGLVGEIVREAIHADNEPPATRRSGRPG